MARGLSQPTVHDRYELSVLDINLLQSVRTKNALVYRDVLVSALFSYATSSKYKLDKAVTNIYLLGKKSEREKQITKSKCM